MSKEDDRLERAAGCAVFAFAGIAILAGALIFVGIPAAFIYWLVS